MSGYLAGEENGLLLTRNQQDLSVWTTDGALLGTLHWEASLFHFAFDGSRVMKYVLPPAWSLQYQRLAPYGFFILFALITLGRPLVNVWMAPAFALTETAMRLVSPYVLPKVDLAELRGYHYHTGVVFDAYCDGPAGAESQPASRSVARGGRYDEVGKAFGRARPATGFSIDLRSLAGAVAEVIP